MKNIPQEQKTSLQTAGGSANPKFSAFCPSVLPVRKSRSPEVARFRYGSFCEGGCGLAAPEMSGLEAPVFHELGVAVGGRALLEDGEVARALHDAVLVFFQHSP